MNRMALFLISLAVLLSGCKTAYYNTMEALGHPKREILVSRVQDARDSQTEAKEQFQTALEQFSSVVNFKGGQLEDKYDELKLEYERSLNKADNVRKRIASVKSVAEALFDEWEKELDQYTNPQLRVVSESKLEETRSQYTRLVDKMDRAKAKMDPVLNALYDQVLFLKHNLNAQAIVSLKEELIWVEQNTEQLVKEMEAAIVEANAFIGAMSQE
ncbi:MAG: DUF2959 domain-containing protein [Sedimentisphaerales bacterium]|nr:DUF2959 domain-containing protein [Sedimentisphaerales bacterium]